MVSSWRPSFPWYSSHGSDFNYDFHVTHDESVPPGQPSSHAGSNMSPAHDLTPPRRRAPSPGER